MTAFNVQTSKDLHLNEVVGQVCAMTVGYGMLFAGTSASILVSSRFLLVLVLCFFVASKSGSIYVWKATDTESDPFTYFTSMEGCHSGVGSEYSEMYNDLGNIPTRSPPSLLCWDQLTTNLVEVHEGLRTISEVEIKKLKSSRKEEVARCGEEEEEEEEEVGMMRRRECWLGEEEDVVWRRKWWLGKEDHQIQTPEHTNMKVSTFMCLLGGPPARMCGVRTLTLILN
ncbi:hypothetical protein HID58_024997 [Brassica napus]|uniref:Uncharacterized protein n=1 Tax=Brassica napus TaxID=3708 RepID=A0ABQ8CJS7_BRANA|nr:hypothetical protein HID58_024997 [Brassica napus]